MKITVAESYLIFPGDSGSIHATKDMYRCLSAYCDVDLIGVLGPEQPNIYFDEISLTKHFKVYPLQIDLPAKRDAKIFNDDMFVAEYGVKDPKLVADMAKIARDSGLCIADHPYVFRLLKQAAPGKQLWYRSLNVEYDFRLYANAERENIAELGRDTFEIERDCCREADMVLTITRPDAERICALYDIPESKVVNISAGYEFEDVKFVLPSQREKASGRYDLTAFFISNSVTPTINAAREIIHVVAAFPNIYFVIAGSCGTGLRSDKNLEIPENVEVAGRISEERKRWYLERADLALNNIKGGAGLNIKMLEYFAYGVPVVVEQFGMRGIEAEENTVVAYEEKDGLAAAIRSFCELSMAERDAMAQNARKLLEEKYSWDSVAERVMSLIRKDRALSGPDGGFFERRENTWLPHDGGAISVPKGKAVFIWGAGPNGEQCFQVLKEAGYTVAGFVDSNPNKQGKRLNGSRVFSPEQFFNMDQDIAVCVALQYSLPVFHELAQHGIRKENVFVVYSDNDFYFDRQKLERMYEALLLGDKQ